MAQKQLLHADGTAVTAQEAYDAFMNTRVLLVSPQGTTYEAATMEWRDKNSGQVDRANVGYVELYYIRNELSPLQSYSASAGDSSLVPAQQG